MNNNLIIIDDGSKDNSKEIIKKYIKLPNVTVIFQKRKGLAISNNIALNLAKGKYIMRLDADDYLNKYAIQLMSDHLEKNPDFKILGMKAEEFLTSYSDNEYNPRVTYLNGIAKVKSSQQEAGKEILQKLLDDNKTPDYLKGLARSELTSLKLKEKTL